MTKKCPLCNGEFDSNKPIIFKNYLYYMEKCIYLSIVEETILSRLLEASPKIVPYQELRYVRSYVSTTCGILNAKFEDEGLPLLIKSHWKEGRSLVFLAGKKV